MKILGIDGGYYGGLVLIDNRSYSMVQHAEVMPIITYKIAGKKKKGKKTKERVRHDLDGQKIVRLIKSLAPDFAIIEKAQPFPKQGGVSNFSIGGTFNRMRGILEALDIRHEFAHPRTWQKVMFLGMAKTDTKKMSYMACQRLWPNTDWCVDGKPHDGLTDAALIAEYGRRTIGA